MTTLPICTICAHQIRPTDTPCDVEGCPLPMPQLAALKVISKVVRGSFERVEEVPVVPVRTDPLAVAQEVMIDELSRLVAPTISIDPSPEEFEDVADYLLRFAAIADRFIGAIGIEVATSATVGIDKTCFAEPVRAALEGSATYECDREAEALREDMRLVRRITDYREAVRS